jgi:hypothetical protein
MLLVSFESRSETKDTADDSLAGGKGDFDHEVLVGFLPNDRLRRAPVIYVLIYRKMDRPLGER